MPKGIKSYNGKGSNGPKEGPNAPKGNKKVVGNVTIVGNGKAKGSGGPKVVGMMAKGKHSTTD